MVTDAEPWLFADSEAAAVHPPLRPIRPSREFSAVFPRLANLLGRARQTVVELPVGNHLLLAWGDPDSGVRAWLCQLAPESVPADAAPDHRILLSCFGGIVERFNEPGGNWLLNHRQALTAAEVGRDASFLNVYSGAFDPCGGIPIRPAEWYPVAQEANGSCVLCSRRSGELLFFAPDHANADLVPFGRCPMYTLHTHNRAGSLREWVEAIAVQWDLDSV